MTRPGKNTIISLAVFSIAFGFLEAMVVVYLRQLYYPEGFAFPLKPMALEGLSFEYLREISTMVILVSVGSVGGRNFFEKLACFLYCFGIWDIFYYVWLKVLLDWPPSLFTWDILFLIPVVWVGPVLAPVICSVTMTVIGGCILYVQKKELHSGIHAREWVPLSMGAFAIFLTFVWDYTKMIIEGGFILRFLSLGKDPHFQKAVGSYIPTSYHWDVFLLGEGLILFSLFLFCRRMRSGITKSPE
jgi:hypothetical protein